MVCMAYTEQTKAQQGARVQAAGWPEGAGGAPCSASEAQAGGRQGPPLAAGRQAGTLLGKPLPPTAEFAAATLSADLPPTASSQLAHRQCKPLHHPAQALATPPSAWPAAAMSRPVAPVAALPVPAASQLPSPSKGVPVDEASTQPKPSLTRTQILKDESVAGFSSARTPGARLGGSGHLRSPGLLTLLPQRSSASGSSGPAAAAAPTLTSTSTSTSLTSAAQVWLVHNNPSLALACSAVGSADGSDGDSELTLAGMLSRHPAVTHARGLGNMPAASDNDDSASTTAEVEADAGSALDVAAAAEVACSATDSTLLVRTSPCLASVMRSAPSHPRRASETSSGLGSTNQAAGEAEKSSTLSLPQPGSVPGQARQASPRHKSLAMPLPASPSHAFPAGAQPSLTDRACQGQSQDVPAPDPCPMTATPARPATSPGHGAPGVAQGGPVAPAPSPMLQHMQQSTRSVLLRQACRVTPHGLAPEPAQGCGAAGQPGSSSTCLNSSVRLTAEPQAAAPPTGHLATAAEGAPSSEAALLVLRQQQGVGGDPLGGEAGSVHQSRGVPPPAGSSLQGTVKRSRLTLWARRLLRAVACDPPRPHRQAGRPGKRGGR
ncbi:hypothetical protein V8C86DRAFT_2496568 [Haematococcus lacustris]